MHPEKITVQASINAPVATCWSCWTEPAHITQWNFASPEWHCPHATNDLRAGGRYNARMEARDGSFGFDFEATYDKVIDQQRIRYTMDDGRQADTSFAEATGATRVIVTFDAEMQNSMEMQRDGWQAILNNFKSYAEKLHSSANTVDTYIEAFPERTREALRQIRATIRKLAPAAAEKISYAMPAYTLQGKPLVYFAGYAKHIGIYALPNTHHAFTAQLSKYKQGKGSVQFPLDEPLPLALIESIITFRIGEITNKP